MNWKQFIIEFLLLFFRALAVFGKLSTIERDQFTAFGPTVNLASRLEGKAEDNQIIISENTKNKFEYKNKFKLKTIILILIIK
jgi:hypothetical protein